MIETDTRGVDALTGDMPDTVTPPLSIWEGLLADLGPAPQVPTSSWTDTYPFDDEPWRALPTLEDLEKIWLGSPTVDIMIAQLAIKVHGDGPDLPKFIATQRDLAAMELAWIKEREADNATDNRRPGEPAGLTSAAHLGDSVDVPGEPENSHPVGKGRKAGSRKNTGRPSKVSGVTGS